MLPPLDGPAVCPIVQQCARTHRIAQSVDEQGEPDAPRAQQRLGATAHDDQGREEQQRKNGESCESEAAAANCSGNDAIHAVRSEDGYGRYASVQWERMPDTTVCPGDVASSGLLLDYGEVTSHAGKEWMEVKYAVGRRYWLILLAC